MKLKEAYPGTKAMKQIELFDALIEEMWKGKGSLSAVIDPLLYNTDQFWVSLKQRIENGQPTSAMVGPISMISFNDAPQFKKHLLDWFTRKGWVKSSVDESSLLATASLSIFWERFVKTIDTTAIDFLVIAIEAVQSSNIDEIFNFYATLRKFCTEWKKQNGLSVHFVTVGSWIPIELYKRFHDRQVSWPFSPEHNLIYFPDLEPDEVFQLLRKHPLGLGAKYIHALYLWEITMGERFTTSMVIKGMKQSINLSQSIYYSAVQLIETHDFVELVKERISALSSLSLHALGCMLDGIYIDSHSNKELLDELRLSGLIRFQKDGSVEGVRFKNWIIDSTVRCNSEVFKDMIEFSSFKDYQELIPPITCINREAYAVICEIENYLRNIIILRLSILQPNQAHPLVGIRTGLTNTKGSYKDEYERTKKWRDENAASGYVETHDAQMSYLQTADLIELVDQLIYEKDPIILLLLPVRKKLSAVKRIRDAVAHNQIISESSYMFLLDLKEELLQALKQTL